MLQENRCRPTDLNKVGQGRSTGRDSIAAGGPFDFSFDFFIEEKGYFNYYQRVNK
jgi:hypothetical protein